MKTAIVCNTPYQLLNAINIVVNNIEHARENSDLFVVNRFRNANCMVNRIQKCDIFSKIYYVNVKNIINAKTNVFERFIKYSNPKTAFNIFDIAPLDFLENNYNQIFIGDAMQFGMALCRYYHNAKVFTFDDGMSSYFGSYLMNERSAKTTLKRLLFNVFPICPQKNYVNCLKVCKSTVASQNSQLPILDLDNNALGVIKKVFEYKDNCILYSNKYVFLERPFEENKNYNGRNPIELLQSLGIKDNCVFRIHPRSTNKYNIDIIDYGINLWELECLFSISDEHVLMADLSTAQFSPKIIAGKEPYLVFLYNLFCDELDKDVADKYDEQINMARFLYDNENKIFVPKNEEELANILKTIG